MFYCKLLCVHSSIAIILMGKRELVALVNFSSWCLVMGERLFLALPWGCLRFVIVVFPDHTHLLYLTNNIRAAVLKRMFSMPPKELWEACSKRTVPPSIRPSFSPPQANIMLTYEFYFRTIMAVKGHPKTICANRPDIFDIIF